MRIILDTDILVYQAAVGAQQTVNWDGDLYSVFASFTNAKAKFEDIAHDWVAGATAAWGGPDKVNHELVYAFSDPDRDALFRKKLPLVDYKAARSGTKKPLVCRDLEAWAIENTDGVWQPGLEGDDICGLLQGHRTMTVEGQYEPIESIIVTVDKDLLTVPGLVYNPVAKKLERVTPIMAERAFFTQVLMGDRVDGYTGIPNCGPVGAAKILDADPTWGGIVEAYRKKGLGEEFALANARCARILRGNEYNWKTQEVKLWTPNN